jgi:hypothetical protein
VKHAARSLMPGKHCDHFQYMISLICDFPKWGFFNQGVNIFAANAFEVPPHFRPALFTTC